MVGAPRWREIAADKDYGAESYGVAFGPDGRLYTVAYDNKIRRYGPGPGFPREAVVVAHGGKRPYSVAVADLDVDGKLDAIVLTGGLAFSPRVTSEISLRVSFLAPVLQFPGENELEALAMGARDVLLGETRARIYEG